MNIRIDKLPEESLWRGFFEEVLGAGDEIETSMSAQEIKAAFLEWWERKVGNHPPNEKKIARHLAMISW